MARFCQPPSSSVPVNNGVTAVPALAKVVTPVPGVGTCAKGIPVMVYAVVVPPVASSCELLPEQTAAGVAVALAVGFSATVITAVAVAEQPIPSVPVTV